MLETQFMIERATPAGFRCAIAEAPTDRLAPQRLVSGEGLEYQRLLVLVLYNNLGWYLLVAHPIELVINELFLN